MERYQLEKMYENEDEIDLVELLKTIIREKTIVIIITIIFTVLAAVFAFYKEAQPKNYGINVTISEQTTEKFNQYSTLYKNASLTLKQITEDSFKSLLEKNDNEITVISAENTSEITETLKGKYDFIKIIDTKNKSYKLFTKMQSKDLDENFSNKLLEIVNLDTKTLNEVFNQKLDNEIESSENKLTDLKNKTEILNKQVMEIVKDNFNDISKENMSSNLSIVSPILYVEYMQEINDLNSTYLKNVDLKNIKKSIEESADIFALNDKEDISVIEIASQTSGSGLNPKLIILIGAFLGICAGMFFAIIKNPLKDIFKEIKSEKTK